MNIGISIGDKALYIASLEDSKSKPEFYKAEADLSAINSDLTNGYIWNDIDKDIGSLFSSAEKIALTIPAQICYSKIISIDSGMMSGDYPGWLAGIQIPGDLAKYIYGFIPIGNIKRDSMNKVLFYAVPTELFWPLFCAIVKDEVYDNVAIIPEYSALCGFFSERGNDVGSVEEGIVNVGQNGAAVIMTRKRLLSAVRYFPFGSNAKDDLMEGIETYLLSQRREADPARIIVISREEIEQAKSSSSLSFQYKKIHPCFMSALGGVKYLLSGGKCELPAAC